LVYLKIFALKNLVPQFYENRVAKVVMLALIDRNAATEIGCCCSCNKIHKKCFIKHRRDTGGQIFVRQQCSCATNISGSCGVRRGLIFCIL